MSNLCVCDVNLGNTGSKFASNNIMDITSMLMFVRLRADNGTKNTIDATTQLTTAAVDALINQADASKRWYPLSDFEDVELVRADAVFQNLASGRRKFVRDGIRTFNGAIYERNPQFLAQVKKMQCPDIGVYIIDKCDNLYGMISADGTKLEPITIGSGSFYASDVYRTYSEEQKIMISFDWAQTMRDENIRMYPQSEMESGLSLLSKQGLYDITPVVVTGSVTATNLRVELNYLYGTAKTPKRLDGITTAGDWTVYNTTDSAAVVPSDVTEVSPGVYDLTIADQAGDAGTVTATVEGYVVKVTKFTFGS